MAEGFDPLRILKGSEEAVEELRREEVAEGFDPLRILKVTLPVSHRVVSEVAEGFDPLRILKEDS